MTLVLLIALASGPAGASPQGAVPEATEREGLHAASLRTQGVDEAELTRELELRLPDLALVPHAELAARAERGTVVFVDLKRDETAFELVVVASDGRAYERRESLDPEATEREQLRFIATSVANLLFGIEAGTARADREDASLPEHDSPPTPSPSPPARSCPEPPSCPEAASDPVEVAPTWSIGLGPSVGMVVGAGAPEQPDRYAGWGLGFDLLARAPRGPAFHASVRTLTRDDATTGLRIVRARFGLGGGYTWRSAPTGHGLEVQGLVDLVVEPWWVLEGGDRVALSDARAVLMGGMLRTVAGYHFASRNRPLALTVGPFLELSASALVDGGGVVQISTEEEDPGRAVFRAGGLEIGAGLAFTGWFGVR